MYAGVSLEPALLRRPLFQKESRMLRCSNFVSAPWRTARLRTALCATSMVVHQRRTLSSQQFSSTEGLAWLLKRRYGNPKAPYLGVFTEDQPVPATMPDTTTDPATSTTEETAASATSSGSAEHVAVANAEGVQSRVMSSTSDQGSRPFAQAYTPTLGVERPRDPEAELALFRRGLYCKALLYVIGNNRRARDWLVGWACALPSANSELVPMLFQHQATRKDLSNFCNELRSRELPIGTERLVVNCLCMDAATVVAHSQQAGDGMLAEERMFEVGAAVGVTKQWLHDALELAVEERALAWEKYRVLGSDTPS
jgi:hypothetical protein